MWTTVNDHAPCKPWLCEDICCLAHHLSCKEEMVLTVIPSVGFSGRRTGVTRWWAECKTEEDYKASA